MLRIAVFLFLIEGYNFNDALPSITGCVNFGSTPDNYDWRLQMAVSPVKNQGRCGACWAFSAIANIESHLKIYTGQDLILSEQFLIDCGAKSACVNGSIIQTFADIITLFGGVLQASDYPPYEENKAECRWQPRPDESEGKSLQTFSKLASPRPQPSVVPVIGFRRVQRNEDIMAEFVFKCGPLSAAINSASMYHYQGGIDEPTELTCNPSQLDHAILIVGYDVYFDSRTGRTIPYWIIKNSWGPKWAGRNGYYYLVRGRNACGISSDVSYAIVN